MVSEKERSQKAIMLAQRSQLQMLRYQLNPHFLFNSLTSIQTLVHENPEQAETMVEELSDFLRYSLQYNEILMIPVSEELEIARKYLTIERIRFEERLEFTINEDVSSMGVEIPCFITQPLVENSIKHGLQNNPIGINIVLTTSVIEDEFILEVANTGKLSQNWSIGIGLKNILDRLENSYHGHSRFSLSEENGFVIARILIKLINEKANSANNR
jgi:LytS/YehU family sensor histidine kinase